MSMVPQRDSGVMVRPGDASKEAVADPAGRLFEGQAVFLAVLRHIDAPVVIGYPQAGGQRPDELFVTLRIARPETVIQVGKAQREWQTVLEPDQDMQQGDGVRSA